LPSKEEPSFTKILAILRKAISLKELKHSWSRESGFSYKDLADLDLGADEVEYLRHMHKDGLLIESSVTTLLSCPTCHKADYVAIMVCTKCGQSSLKKENLLEHKAGGHAHPESAFRTADGLVCPTCGKKLTPADYRILGSWYVCEKCGAKQPQPKLTFRCLADETLFTETTGETMRLTDYKVSEKGVKMLELDKQTLVKQLAALAEQKRVKLVKGFSISGNSGITHVFDFSLQYGNHIYAVDVIYGKDQVNGSSILACYAKLIDTNIKNYLLISWPQLSPEAKALASHYNIKVIEASAFEDIERSFVAFLEELQKMELSQSVQTTGVV